MEILVAILIIALIAAVVFAVMQRRPEGARGLGRQRTSPLPRRDRGARRRDPMAAAVEEHAEATDPQDVVAAEQRMRAQARQVAAGLHTEEARRSEHQRASDPAYGDDPRYDEPQHGGRPAADPVDPRHDDRRR